MSEFNLYLQLGFEHISDVNGYDHILFILALCAVYYVTAWRKLVVLVTAFTVGHSLTLAMATLGLVKVNSELIEFLIPVTIVLTCLANLYNYLWGSKSLPNRNVLRYFSAVFFGLIHGLGFSNYLSALLGSSSDLLLPLFAFNLGLEFGQLLIVAFFLLLSYLIVGLAKVRFKWWVLVLSSIVLLMAGQLLVAKWIF